MLKDEINSVIARQECREQKMHIPKFDTTIEVLSERLEIAEEELKKTEDICS
jgi:hypothetical protein